MLRKSADSAPLPPLFAGAFSAAAAVSLVPIWSVKYLPMVDLPQHAAQIFLWRHISEEAHGFSEVYELEMTSPYLAAHAILRLLALALPLPAATRVMASLAVIALPLAMLHLYRRGKSDVWAALAGFPLAYGFAFYWGFTNYLVAVPVGLVFVTAALDYARRPARRDGFGLAAFAFVLFLCHGLVFALCVPIVVLGVWAQCRDPRQALRGLWPLVPAALAIGIWVAWLGSTDPNAAPPPQWSEPPWQRLRDLPALVVGAGRKQGIWWLGGLLVLLLPLVGGRPRLREPWRLVPAATVLALFLAVPNYGLGTWFVYPRFAVFVAVFGLMILRPAPALWRRRLGAALMLAFIAGWMIFLRGQFRAVDADGRQFDVLLERMEPARSVLGLNFDPGYDLAAGLPVFGHFHMWYQAQKGGLAEFSFAMAYPQLVRYRQGRGPLAHPDLSLHPERFDFQRDGRFDYFLVRADEDLGEKLFAGAPVAFEARAGKWWLYRRIPET